MKSFVVAVFCVFFSSPSFACSCAGGLPIEKYCESTDAIFSGKVILSKTIDPDGSPMSQDEYVEYVLEVADWYKAKGAAYAVVRSSAWGNLCGLDLEMGQEYLLWGYRAGADFFLHTNICTRTRLLPAANDDLAWLTNHPGEC